MMKNYGIKAAVAGILVGLLCHSVSAQTFLLQSLPENNPQFSLRYLRPNFEADVDFSTFSGIYDLSFDLPVSSNLNLIGSLPFTAMDFEGPESESGIGNIYIGFQTRRHPTPERTSSVSFGLFLPTAPDDKFSLLFVNIYTNLHQQEKYIPDMLTVYGNYAYHSIQPGGVKLGVEFGPQLYVPTDDEGDESELFVHYGFTGGAQVTHFAIFAELVGLAVITEEADEFGDRFTHSLVFGSQWTEGIVKPGIFYQIYLDEDMEEVVDGVFGIKIETSLK